MSPASRSRMRAKAREAYTCFAMESAPSPIDGKGTFALTGIPAHRKLGEMGGLIVRVGDARRSVKGKRRYALVEFGDGYALLQPRKAGALEYINHSCRPNAYIRVAYRRVEFYSLRRIRAGEEITCDYGPDSHGGTHQCACGLPGCRGRL